MKKYKLKKDFSFLKSGDKVFLDFDCRKGKEFVEVYTLKSTYIGNMEVLKNTTSEFFEKIPEKPKSVWEMEYGDDYFRIRNEEIDCYCWEDLGFDIRERDMGNIFLTREEAEKELERRKAIQKIKKYCWENGIEAEYEEERNSKLFYIEIDGEFEGQINFDSFPPVYSPIGYFSYENAEKILENFEEELKIILDV